MNEATALAELVIDELVHQGVAEFVLCPGSRSAPLAFAALAAAEAGRLRLHVRVDERSAGFLALGLAKVSGRPVPVACTSGSAVANLHPAVVEASYAGVPLIALTADRPVESRGVGSPQTIDQLGIFGSDARLVVDLGRERRSALDAAPGAGAGPDRATVAAAVAAALGNPTGGPTRRPHPPGPVQINVGLRMPLVPPQGARARGGGPAPSHPPHPRDLPLAHCGCRDLAELLGGEVPARGVMLVGDLPIAGIAGLQQWIAALAGSLGWPILAEPTSNLHGAETALDHGVLVLSEPVFAREHVPDILITLGAFGLSRPTMALVAAARRHVAVDLGLGRERCDPLRTASDIMAAVPLPPGEPVVEPSWLADWQAADRAAGAAVAGVLSDAGSFTGIHAAVQTTQAAQRDGLLLVAASWPVRHVEAFAALPPGVDVIGNRGTNGIDGLISTAWGAALAHQRAGGGPALALLGDLAALHDHNGLLAPPGEPEPDLALVVVDNGGGGIFHQLEQGQPRFAGQFERLFGTPHGLDLVAVARAAGRPAVGVSSAAALRRELARPGSGVRVVVAKVVERAVEAQLLAELSAAARQAVAGSWGSAGR